MQPTSKEFKRLKAELEGAVTALEKHHFESPLPPSQRQPGGPATVSVQTAVYFLEPVNVEMVPDYLSVVSTPMDLSTIKRKVAKGSYLDPRAFKRDVELIFSNCRAYNTRPEDFVRVSADVLEKAKSCLVREKLERAMEDDDIAGLTVAIADCGK